MAQSTKTIPTFAYIRAAREAALTDEPLMQHNPREVADPSQWYRAAFWLAIAFCLGVFGFAAYTLLNQ